MRVYFPDPPSPEVLAELRTAAGESIQVLSEEQPGDYEVLIEGRPDVALLNAPSLRALIVPFAGVPLSTLELLKARPEIAGYNLHHNAADTADMALALLLAAAKQVVPMDQALRRKDWTGRYEDSRVISLPGRTALILGYGEIGKRIARALVALEMNVVAVRRSAWKGDEGPVRVAPATELRNLLPVADVLVVALPQTEETTGLIGRNELALMPKSGILVNVARGAIVDEEALYDALKEGRLHSAGLDVWYRYPEAQANAVPGYFSVPDSAKDTAPSKFPFGELDNVVLSPHRAGISMETENRRVQDLAKLLQTLAQRREAANRINLDAGY